MLLNISVYKYIFKAISQRICLFFFLFSTQFYKTNKLLLGIKYNNILLDDSLYSFSHLLPFNLLFP